MCMYLDDERSQRKRLNRCTPIYDKKESTKRKRGFRESFSNNSSGK